jgi:hypothetical protein
MDQHDVDQAWMQVVQHFRERATEAESKLELALSALADTLHFVADVHPDDRCLAIDKAQEFYNTERPCERIAPSEMATFRMVQQQPGEGERSAKD